MPQAESFAALNARLEARCRERQGARLRGHEESIGERLARDRAAMLPLPAAPYEACETRSARVSSLSLVRYRGNDYSVPVAYGHREVLVRGYVEAVVVGCGAAVVARHRRSYGREDVLLEPLHYCRCSSARSARWTRRPRWPAGRAPSSCWLLGKRVGTPRAMLARSSSRGSNPADVRPHPNARALAARYSLAETPPRRR